jgi:hypothetical protein
MKKPAISGVFFLSVLGCTALSAARFFPLDASAKTDPPGSLRAISLMFSRTPSYSPEAWLQGGERFPLGGEIVVKNGSQSHPLIAGFVSAVDPSLNFEGTSVLFAGKASVSDPWQIYEMGLSGGKPRRVTSGVDDCIRPIYLPDGRFVYARKITGRFVLEVSALDGTGVPLRLTYAPGNFLPTDVLQDGRVLFESNFPLGSSGQPEIYTVYPDGSGVESYRCDHGHARSNGKQTATGEIVFASKDGLGRFTSAVAHEVTVNVPQGDYTGGIAESRSAALILSFRAAPSGGNDSASESYVLKLWNPGTHTLETLAAEPDENLVEPVVIAARPVTNRFPTALHNWKTTNLLALNSYVSREAETPSGTVAAVRVSTLDSSGYVTVLGTAPVEKDGSFFIQAPGDSPLKFELLNAQGNVVRKEDGWMWARSGEQRICVGCHAGPERAPDNAVPAVLLRTTTPVNLTGTPVEAVKGGN